MGTRSKIENAVIGVMFSLRRLDYDRNIRQRVLEAANFGALSAFVRSLLLMRVVLRLSMGAFEFNFQSKIGQKIWCAQMRSRKLALKMSDTA